MESSLNDPSFNTTHGSSNYDTAEDGSITSMYYSINDMESTLEATRMSQDISSMTLDDVGFPNQNITSQPVTTSNSSYINFNMIQQDAAMPDDAVNFLDQGLHEPNSSTRIIASSADEHSLMSEHSKQDHELGNKPILLGSVNQNQNIEDEVINETESTHETMGQIVDTADGPMVLYKIPGSDELYAIPVDADQYEELMRESQNGSQIILTDESSCHMEQEKSLFSKPSNEEVTIAPLTARNIIEDNDISTDILDKQSNNVYSTNVSVEERSYASQDTDIQNATGIDNVPEISSKIKHVQCASDGDKIDSSHQVGNWQDYNEEYLDEEFLEYETTDGEPVTGDYDEKYEVTNEKAQCEANVIPSAATFAQGTSLQENAICDPNLTHESDMQKTLNELHQKQSKLKMNRAGSSQIKGGQSLLNTNNITFRTFRKMVPIGADYGLSNNTVKKCTIKKNVVTKPVLNQSGVKVMPNLKPLYKECRNNASTKEIENVKNVHPQSSSSRDESQKILIKHYAKPNVKTGCKNMTFLLISQPAANNQSHQQPKLTAVPLMSNESMLLKRNVQSSRVFNITKDGNIVICDSKGSVSNTVVSEDVESSEPTVQDKERAPDLVKNKPRVRKQVLSTVNRDDLEITFEPVNTATVIETEKAKRSDGKSRSIRKSIKLKLNNSSHGKVEVTQLSDDTHTVKETGPLEKNIQTKSTTGKKNQANKSEDEDLKLPNVKPDMNSDENCTLENKQKPVKKSEKNEINIVDNIPDSDLKPSRFSNRLSNKPKSKKCRILSCNCDLEHHFNESVFQSDGYDSDDSQTFEKTIFSQDEDAPSAKQKRGKSRKRNSIDKEENNSLVSPEKGADMKIDNAELLCSSPSTASSCVKESDKKDTDQGSSVAFNDGDILTKMQEIHKDVFADDAKESSLKEEDDFEGFIPDSELRVADLWVAFLCKVAKDDDEGNIKKSTVEIKTQGQEYVIDVTPAKPVLRSKIPKSNKLKRTISVTAPPSKMLRLQHSTEIAKKSSDTPSKVDNIVVTTRMSMRQNPTQQPTGPYVCKHCFKQFAFESVFNNHITERCTKITDNERLKYITNLKQTGSKVTKVSNKSNKVISLTPKPTFKVPKLNSNIKAARLIPSKVISSRVLLGLHKSPNKQVQNSGIGLLGRRSTNHAVANKESRMAQTKELHTRSFIRFNEKRRSKSTPDASVIKIKTKSAEKLRTNRRTLEPESKKAVLRRSISAASVHKCSKCHEVYPTRAALFKHSNTHKDDPDLLKCSECCKIFKTKLARNAHLTLHAQKKIATKPLDLILNQTSVSTNRRQTRQFPPGGKLKPRIAHGGIPLSTRMQKVFQRLKESTS